MLTCWDMVILSRRARRKAAGTPELIPSAPAPGRCRVAGALLFARRMLGAGSDGRVGAADVVDQRRRCHTEAAGEAHDRAELDVLLAALHAGDVGELHVAALPELLERQTRVLAQPAHLCSEHRLWLQASACSGSMCLRSRTGSTNHRDASLTREGTTS